jgi:hypothetical protein
VTNKRVCEIHSAAKALAAEAERLEAIGLPVHACRLYRLASEVEMAEVYDAHPTSLELAGIRILSAALFAWKGTDQSRVLCLVKQGVDMGVAENTRKMLEDIRDAALRGRAYFEGPPYDFSLSDVEFAIEKYLLCDINGAADGSQE